MFDLFQFTEKTTRLRRNLLVFALLCFCVGFFNVSVESIPLGGYAIRLPPKAFEFALASMLIYHFITFYWAALDEYKHWRLTVADKSLILADAKPPEKRSFLFLINNEIRNIKKYNDNKEIIEKIEGIELVIDGFVNKFKKYRKFTIIRVCFVELVIPIIATLIAFFWGVMQFQYLRVDFTFLSALWSIC